MAADLVAHIGQAKHNRSCAEYLLAASGMHDWSITMAFYSALHYVEAALNTVNRSTLAAVSMDAYNAHHERRVALQSTSSKESFTIYRKLENACLDVRYLRNYRSASKIAPSLGYYSNVDARQYVNMLADFVTELERVYRVNLG